MEIATEGALKLGSKSVSFLLGTIVKCAKEIRTITQRTKGNKLQCRRLSERIEIFAETLQGRKLKETTDQSMKLALARFIVFLKECIELMEEYCDTGTIKRLWNNKTDCEKFKDLHETFSHRIEAIQTSATLTPVFVDDDEQLLEIQDTESDDCHSSVETIDEVINCKQSDQKENIFVTGVWKYQRSLDETWSHPFYMEFSSFDIRKKTLRGFGEDDRGRFRVTGTLCPKTQTMKITWSYTNEKSNGKHTLRLKWDNEQNVFRIIPNPKSTDLSVEQFEMTLFTPLSDD